MSSPGWLDWPYQGQAKSGSLTYTYANTRIISEHCKLENWFHLQVLKMFYNPSKNVCWKVTATLLHYWIGLQIVSKYIGCNNILAIHVWYISYKMYRWYASNSIPCVTWYISHHFKIMIWSPTHNTQYRVWAFQSRVNRIALRLLFFGNQNRS